MTSPHRPSAPHHNPQPRPKGRPAGFQRWQHLLFLHWEVAAERVQAVLPDGLEVDTHDGKTYVGVVPFTMRDVSPWWSPSVPGISNFHELNVRVYAKRGDNHGVFFLSLDAADTLPVLIARNGWHLPYYKASMRLDVADNEVHYRSRRQWPQPTPASLRTHYRFDDSLRTAEPGSLAHFLLERYVLFAVSDGQLEIGRVHHEPYPHADVELLELTHDMTAPAGLPACDTPPDHVAYSPGVDVDVYALEPL